jgi:zinc transporter ZupT
MGQSPGVAGCALDTLQCENERQAENPVNSSLWVLISLLLAVVLSSAAAGVWLGGRRRSPVGLVPLSGGVLAGVALFWMLPEVAGRLGWTAALGTLAGGAGLLWGVDRFVYPVCPVCSHSHDHASCAARLHGFAAPLILAVGIHSFLDGVGIAVSQAADAGAVGRAVLWGLALHKVPEGLALGIMLRASVRSWAGALGGSLAAQAPMVAGTWIEAWVAPGLGDSGIMVLLAAAGGSFFFLGAHAVHGEFKRERGPAALAAAGAGFLVAALLPHLVAGFAVH